MSWKQMVEDDRQREWDQLSEEEQELQTMEHSLWRRERIVGAIIATFTVIAIIVLAVLDAYLEWWFWWR